MGIPAKNRRVVNRLKAQDLKPQEHRSVERNDEFPPVEAELRSPRRDIRHKGRLIFRRYQQIAGSAVLDLNSIEGQSQSTSGIR